MYRISDGKVIKSVMLPVPPAQANVSLSVSKEWADDASRAIWSDIVLGIQNETGTTSYRPHRMAIKWKLGVFVAGAALGWVAGTLLSAYALPETSELADGLKYLKPVPATMDQIPTLMQETSPVACPQSIISSFQATRAAAGDAPLDLISGISIAPTDIIEL